MGADNMSLKAELESLTKLVNKIREESNIMNGLGEFAR